VLLQDDGRGADREDFFCCEPVDPRGIDAADAARELAADAWLLVDRPPRTREAAEAIAAEHWAFADEFHGKGRCEFGDLVDTIIGRPVWHFWWD